MSAIGPGDWVECVEATGRPRLVLGGVYRVSHLGENDDGAPLVALIEIPKRPNEEYWGYFAWRFRPIYRPKESLLRDLMQPIDTKVDA